MAALIFLMVKYNTMLQMVSKIYFLAAQIHCHLFRTEQTNKFRGPLSTSELYRLIDRHLSMKLVPTSEARGVSRNQPGGSPTVVNLSFLDRRRYFSFT
jgi:hypothetical protein